MDALSTMLRTVHLEDALFCNSTFTAPWRVRSPRAPELAPLFSNEQRHVIVYHLVTEGQAYACLEDGACIQLGPGDIVVFPHGDAHAIGNGRADIPAADTRQVVERLRADRDAKLPPAGGGGEVTRLVCGFLLSDPQLSPAFLGALPPMFKVNVCCGSEPGWVEDSIHYAVEKAAADAAGSAIVVAKLSEALFVETLRRYLEEQPPAQAGWLAGANDPEVGKALVALHRKPAEPWTIARLARQVGVSRSVLAERFRQFLGVPPMAYLAQARMQLGAQLLTSTRQTVAQIAAQVGYESEAAFNRAFKRTFGAPPARFRTMARESSAAD